MEPAYIEFGDTIKIQYLFFNTWPKISAYLACTQTLDVVPIGK